jgi:uncharacterized protein
MMRTKWTGAVVSGALIGMLAVVAVSCAGSGTERAAAAPTTEPEQEQQEDSSDMARTITVTGDGRVTVKPDTAVVQMGVQVTGQSAQDVLDQANEGASALIEALQGLGVAEDDIATAGLAIYPQYADDGSRVTGYQASNELRVTIRDIDRAGEIIDGGAAFAGDAITIHGISFSVADPEAVMGDARVAAIESAKKRAQEYAAAAGVEVGAVVSISESSMGPVPFERYAPMGAAADAAMPVMTGTAELTATVTVVFELV